MKLVSRRAACGALATLASAVVAGCAAPAYHVDVYLSPQLKTLYKVYPSVEVDIVGLDANAAERFAATSVEDYFKPDNALRASTPHATLRFSERDVVPKELPAGDAVWEKFGETEADQLCLLANLPPLQAPPAAEKGALAPKVAGDGRKVVMPLEKDSIFNPRRWFGWPTRVVEIVPVGLNVRADAPERAPSPTEIETEYEREAQAE